MSQPDIPPPPPAGDWREQRRRERHERRAARRAMPGGWIGPSVGGLVLLVLGLGLLAQNLGYGLPGRWWALLLLLPAVGALVAAMRSYRAVGPGPDSVGELIGAGIFTLLALALFFGLNWGIFWPVALIVLGAAILVRGYRPR